MFNPAWLSLLFDADDAALLTGAKLPQIEYFVRTELIQPAQRAIRRGVSRRYDLKNLIEIAVAAEMLESGIPAVEIGRAFGELRGNWDLLFGDPAQREKTAVLAITVMPLTSIKRSPHALVQIGPPAMLTAYAQAVVRVAVPLEAIVRNVESKIWALEQWKASRPSK